MLQPTHKGSVLFTRPLGQGEELVTALEDHGWHCIRQPLLEIQPFQTDSHTEFLAIKQHILNLCDFDVVISVSSNASTLAVDWIDQYWPQIPEGIHWYAVGPSSALPFKKLGIEFIVPAKNHSEGLLLLDGLQDMTHKKVLILRGKGGRELLADTLKSRGASVQYAQLYERVPLRFSDGELAKLLSQRQIHYALITSAEMAQQLAHELTPLSAGLNLYLIVPSERIAKIATTLGFEKVHVCGHLKAENLLASLDSISVS